MKQTFDLPNDRMLLIEQDYNPETPRNWDNLTKIIAFGKYRGLGDKHDINSNNFSDWDDNKQGVMKEYDVVVIKPLYMYSHSGETISTSPFSCPWDSGQLGWVIVTKEDLRKEYGLKRVSKKFRLMAENILEAEIEVLDQYIRGDVYLFDINDSEGDTEDSCSGFYGSDIRTNGILDHLSEEDREAILEQL